MRFRRTARKSLYASNVDEVEATSTNNEIFVVPISGGAPKKISTSPGADTTPLYSPDGKYLAWRSQARAGFEADKWRLLVQDRQSGKTRERHRNVLTGRLEASRGIQVEVPVIYCGYETSGQAVFGQIVLDMGRRVRCGRHSTTGQPNLERRYSGWPFGRPCCRPRDILLHEKFRVGAAEIWGQRIRSFTTEERKPKQITHLNDALLSQIDMQPLESFTFKGANNDDVQGFMVNPPGFDPNKKYPLKFLLHGGPQGAWGNSWTYRWNAEVFAATGNYVVVMINFHGSTGYGQKFTDSISGDWGGKPYVDVMKGLDYVEKTYPFIDKNREAALGASYGGYMANWLLGHTNRFKCIVSHDGMFNAESAYGTTEELWFANWEFGGPPWKKRDVYRKWSPHEYAQNFKTPTLVVHGQNDYRLDVSQGFDLFTTLQVLKVPSKMLYFPDEGHWVLKPQNSQLWYKTVNDWADQWCKP